MKYSDIFRRPAEAGDPVGIRQLRIAEALEAGKLTRSILATIAAETATPLATVKREGNALETDFAKLSPGIGPGRNSFVVRMARLKRMQAADARRQGLTPED